MKVQQFTAKNAELAIEEGLKTLGVTREQAKIEVLSEGGLFKKAEVRLTVEDTVGDKACAFLSQTLKLMNLESQVEVTDESTDVTIDVKGDATKEMFSRSGETVDALQYLTGLVANAGSDDYRRVVLDSEDYRNVREERLCRLADDMANKAIERGYRIKMEPMNPYERRVVHTHLTARSAEVSTHSEGEEPYRFLVITPVVMKAKTYEPKDEATSNYSDRPRRDGRYHPSSERNVQQNGGRRGSDNGERREGGNRNNNNRNGGNFNRNNGGYGNNRPDGEKRDFNRDGAARPDGERRDFNRDGAARPDGERRDFNRNGAARPDGERRDFNRNGGERRDGDRRDFNRNGGRGGFDRNRGGRGGRDDRPPRTAPTTFGTILTTPIKPKDDEAEKE